MENIETKNNNIEKNIDNSDNIAKEINGNSINEINEIQGILPFTIWDEMAESNILIEYMRKFINSAINTNSELKSQLFNSLYSHSNEIIPEVEQYFAEKYHCSLEMFLNRIKKWKNQKQ